MRIAVDASELTGNPTGVGRYLDRLLAHWADLPEAQRHTFLLYVPALPGDPPPATLSPRLRAEWRALKPCGSTRWQQVRLASALRHERPNVLFAPAYSAPLLSGTPVVLAIHDLSFVAHPEWFPPRHGLRRRWLTRLSARAARAIVTISEFSRSEIIRLLGVSAERIRVIPPGLTPPHRPGPGLASWAPAPGDLAGAREPLVLYVGSVLNRRRVPDLIRGFALLARDHADLRLAIVGEDRSYPHQDLTAEAAASGVADQVTIHSYVSEPELARFYRRASAFAFLSEYEGFGLTPLEAMANGVPVVVLDTRVAREVYGNAAVYVEKGEIAETAGALRLLLFDPLVRARVLKHAPVVLARYSWERAARETLALVERAARAS